MEEGQRSFIIEKGHELRGQGFSSLQEECQVCYFCLKRLGSSGIGSTRLGLTQNGNQIIHFCNKDCRENSKVFYEVEKRADWSAYDGHCRYADSTKIVAKTLTGLGFKNCWIMLDGFFGGRGWSHSRLGIDSYNSFVEVISPSQIIPPTAARLGTTSFQ